MVKTQMGSHPFVMKGFRRLWWFVVVCGVIGTLEMARKKDNLGLINDFA